MALGLSDPGSPASPAARMSEAGLGVTGRQSPLSHRWISSSAQPISGQNTRSPARSGVVKTTFPDSRGRF